MRDLFGLTWLTEIFKLILWRDHHMYCYPREPFLTMWVKQQQLSFPGNLVRAQEISLAYCSCKTTYLGWAETREEFKTKLHSLMNYFQTLTFHNPPKTKYLLLVSYFKNSASYHQKNLLNKCHLGRVFHSEYRIRQIIYLEVSPLTSTESRS